MRFRSFAFGSLAFAILAALTALDSACGSKGTLAGQGAQCNVATDCQNGLACIPQKSGNSICSNNLSSVQQLPPTPDAGPAQAEGDSGESDDGPGVIIPEDTGAPKVNDSGGSSSGGDG